MKIEVKLKPFVVPNFVNVDMGPGKREDGPQSLPSFPLAELSAEALDELCTTFRRDIFDKAAKRDPEWDRPRQGCSKCGEAL